jgi:hypothetical protein
VQSGQADKVLETYSKQNLAARRKRDNREDTE